MQKIIYGHVSERGAEIMGAHDLLESEITKDAHLLTIVNAFSQMCRLEIDGKDEMFLFEVGPILYNDKNMLLFSMVRQFSDGKDEPKQIHADLIYNPEKISKSFLPVHGTIITEILYRLFCFQKHSANARIFTLKNLIYGWKKHNQSRYAIA